MNLYFQFFLTRIKVDFAQHDPSIGEKQPQLDEAGYPVKKMDGHVSCLLQHEVRHVRIRQDLPVVGLPSKAEHHFGPRENLKRCKPDIGRIYKELLYMEISQLEKEIGAREKSRSGLKITISSCNFGNVIEHKNF